MRLRPPVKEGSSGSVVTLRKIEYAVAVRRAEILQRRRALPQEPVEVCLRPDTSARLMSGASIRLMV